MSKTNLSKIIPFEALNKLGPVTLVHGVFDLLHIGHFRYFEFAKSLGLPVVVSLTPDQYVNKGPWRPAFTASVRAETLSHLDLVDHVVVNNGPLATSVIKELKPKYYVKGPDYRDKTQDVTGGIYEEEACVKAYGGELVFSDDETFSSSQLINRFLSNFSEEQKHVVQKVKDLGGYEEVFRQINRLSSLNVLVVGEPILDVYRFCEPENISSKSPSVSARFLYEEVYEGGATAIANHLKDFANISFIQPNGFKTPRKTRYIAQDKQQRIFEITEIEQEPWKGRDSKQFTSFLREENERADATLIADFGHGLFEGDALWAVAGLKGFVGLNVQTNSSNYGYNVFKKHKRFDYLSLDLREARLAYHDKHASPMDLHKRILKDVPGSVAMTLGKNGAYFNGYYSPAFSDNVIDATGAGDAFFAITALLAKIECPSLLIPFIGNVYAGLKTRIIGNKSAVPKAALLKAIESILK
jgi:cytidyltransferase-like protein